MKSTIISLLLLLLSFAVSKSQPSVRELKELVVVLDNQNSKLTYKLISKDSIILSQDTLLIRSYRKIKLYQGDSISFNTQLSAFRKGLQVADKTIVKQNKRIKRQGFTIKTLGTIIIISGVYILVKAIKEDN